MKKTLTDILLTHSLLGNIVNLEESIAKKDEEINVLKEEIYELETLMAELEVFIAAKDIGIEALHDKISNLKARITNLLEQNKNLEQERFNLSVHIDKLNTSAVVAAKNTNEEENHKLYSLAGWVSFDATNEAQLTIFNACKKLCVRLIEKNKVGEKSTVTPLQLLQAFIHIIK